MFFGHTDDLPVLNPDEVASYRYMAIDELAADMQAHPESYTEWFKISFDEVRNHL